MTVSRHHFTAQRDIEAIAERDFCTALSVVFVVVMAIGLVVIGSDDFAKRWAGDSEQESIRMELEIRR